MTLLFGVCAAIGGVAAILSLVLGGDHDTDASVDADAGMDADAGAGGHDADHGVHADVGGDFWVLFTSVRFWVFFLLFFGLAGLLFQITGLSDLAAVLVSLPFGLLVGSGAAWAFRRLMVKPVTSTMSPGELVGMEAKVMLPIGSGQVGKVRLELKGTIVDRVAFTEGGEAIERGERALVIAVRGDRLLVSRAPVQALGDGSGEGA